MSLKGEIGFAECSNQGPCSARLRRLGCIFRHPSKIYVDRQESELVISPNIVFGFVPRCLYCMYLDMFISC